MEFKVPKHKIQIQIRSVSSGLLFKPCSQTCLVSALIHRHFPVFFYPEVFFSLQNCTPDFLSRGFYNPVSWKSRIFQVVYFVAQFVNRFDATKDLECANSTKAAKVPFIFPAKVHNAVLHNKLPFN